ncbi:MAG: AAA family ATPase [Burkholderiaceae bacterium]|nr:AAA family ATPase [Burkholderiaceae bacterium]
MANGDQIKAMLRAYKLADESQLLTIALQIAAREAKAGHNRLAEEIRELVDQLKAKSGHIAPYRGPTPIAQPKGELADLISASYPNISLDELILCPETLQRLNRVISEQRQSSRIQEYGLSPRRKLLLVGPPGTGKTMTAKVLATELSLPLFSLKLESLFTRYMGEAATKLKLIFENIQQVRGVYLFDEFDAIGQKRATANDIGEIRRILNSFLQLIEQDTSGSVITAATNHPELLDAALFRRFDDVLKFELPDRNVLTDILKRRLRKFSSTADYEELAVVSDGLSHADIQRACDDAIKDMIISGKNSLSTDDILHSIRERLNDRGSFSNRL